MYMENENVQLYKELLQLKDEYIELLRSEINVLVGISYIHGWNSKNVHAGQVLREKISKLEDLLINNNLKTSEITLTDIKDPDGWHMLGNDLGFSDKKIYSVFEYN